MNSEIPVKEALKILKAKSNCSWNKVFRNPSLGAKIAKNFYLKLYEIFFEMILEIEKIKCDYHQPETN